jgi:L-alanine-DL-glutamate epimerase-like enolase superfamily enzyme
MRVTALETLRKATQPNLLLLRLRTEDGLVGLGESFFGARAVEAYLHETAAPVLLGADDASPERMARLLPGHVGFAGSGVETRGNGAIDLALWDLLGQQTGLPVSALLGGPVRRELPVYNTCAGVSYVQDEPRQAVSNWGLPGGGAARRYEDLDAFLHRPGLLARDLFDEGFRAMKVWPFDAAAEATLGTRLERAEMLAGLRVLDAIRAEVGEEMEILVELHGLWSLPAATRLLGELERFHPFWVEDPLRPDAAKALGQLRRQTAVPIATGESLAGRGAFRALLDEAAIDVAIVDLGWTGGLTEARKIAALADTYAVPVAPHDCTGPISFAACVQFVTSQPNGLIQEHVRAFHRTWYGDLVTGLPEVAGGRVALPDAPGLGVRLVDGLDALPDVVRRVSTAPAGAAEGRPPQE